MILLSVGPGRLALCAPEAVRTLAEAGHDIRVYLEGGAREFVGPASFYSHGTRDAANVILAPEDGIGASGATCSAELPDPPDALIFAPADSAAISRLAHGLGETPAMREYLSRSGGGLPVLLVPDLDPETASHPAVMENLALLEREGCTVLRGLGSKATADVTGEISSRALHEIGGPLDGLRVVVTAGGTREPVDSVRFVGNRSSGKMGAAIARQAYHRGAKVSVVAANVSASREPGVDWVAVETFAGLRAETMRLCEDADVLIMAAAVSDFTPASPLPDEKIRRGSREEMTLELAATPDVLAAIRERRPDLFMVGFAATHGNPLPDAREKLRKKGMNLMVGNDISVPGIGFGSEDNEAFIVMESGSGDGYEEVFVPRGPKTALASVILGHLTPAIKHREV